MDAFNSLAFSFGEEGEEIEGDEDDDEDGDDEELTAEITAFVESALEDGGS